MLLMQRAGLKALPGNRRRRPRHDVVAVLPGICRQRRLTLPRRDGPGGWGAGPFALSGLGVGRRCRRCRAAVLPAFALSAEKQGNLTAGS
jgi:hypothetical protein